MRYFLLTLCFTMLVLCRPGFAEEIPAVQAEKVRPGAGREAGLGHGAEAWLVTFGPGEIYWERFGHNAIWLREPAQGIDHTFSFGYFDFDQEDFHLRFARGRMLYFSVGQSAQREFDFYRQQNRSIRLQKLNLKPEQYIRLRDHLLHVIRPENRDYRYDYYLDNCSTRIRDALDIALDGALAAGTENVPADFNFRDHTRRLTQIQYWYYLGLQLGLGYPTDRGINRWEEMFIPMVVADEIAEMTVPGSEVLQPVVLQDMMLSTSSMPAPPAEPGSIWYRYLLLGLLVAGIGWLSARFMPDVWAAGLSNAWLLIGGTAGLVLAFFWWFTDHSVASFNANVLLLNPLTLLALVPALNRFGALLLAGGVGVNLILLMIPHHQYNLDALALLAPVNLLVAGYFFGSRK